MPLLATILVMAVMTPLILWLGLANPKLIPGVSTLPWNNPVLILMVVGNVIGLFFIPLIWMLRSGRGDFAAMWLMQNALIAGGYFFLPETSEALGLPGVGPVILRAGVWIGLINALGFLILLVTLGLTYLFASLSRARVKPLSVPPEDYDQRLVILLRLAGLFNAGAILISMVATHTVPMLAADPMAARYIFDDNPLTRPLYNASMAILPFVAGGLLVVFFRNPRRCFGLDGMLAGAVLVLQLLSGNRFTLAIAAMVSITLLSMEKKWPRRWLLIAVCGYLFLFVGLSGLTSIWRQNRDALSGGGNLLTASFHEAYVGNNLIDYRDAAWVFGEWDQQPLMGKTYLGGLADMVPSAIFPMKRQWHLGQTALRIVGWGDEKHFGLRLSCFGESFLNFGFAGVVGLAIILGINLGVLLRYLHLLGDLPGPPCLTRNLSVVMVTQMVLIWTNSSDAYGFWALLVLLIVFRLPMIYCRPKTVFPELMNERNPA